VKEVIQIINIVTSYSVTLTELWFIHQTIVNFTGLNKWNEYLFTYLIFIKYSTIIDFPNLGITYNGGWCTATIARWNSI